MAAHIPCYCVQLLAYIRSEITHKIKCSGALKTDQPCNLFKIVSVIQTKHAKCLNM